LDSAYEDDPPGLVPVKHATVLYDGLDLLPRNAFGVPLQLDGAGRADARTRPAPDNLMLAYWLFVAAAKPIVDRAVRT